MKLQRNFTTPSLGLLNVKDMMSNVGEDVKQLELSYTAMCVNSYNHFQNLFDSIS